MAGITQEQAEAQLASYLAAETAVLAGQSYAWGDRTLTRANLAEIREGIRYWNSMAHKKSRSGPVVRGGTPA